MARLLRRLAATRAGRGASAARFPDTAYLVPIVAAVLLSTWAGTRVPKGLRGFWLLVSLACASWFAGEVVWAIVELGGGSMPFPWWPDVGYLGFYGLILVGLVFSSARRCA